MYRHFGSYEVTLETPSFPGPFIYGRKRKSVGNEVGLRRRKISILRRITNGKLEKFSRNKISEKINSHGLLDFTICTFYAYFPTKDFSYEIYETNPRVKRASVIYIRAQCCKRKYVISHDRLRHM